MFIVIRSLLLAFIMGCLLSACSLGATPEPTREATITPFTTATDNTETATATTTSTSTATPTRSATATASGITGCTNDLTFIADMSVPDGTIVTAGSTLTKTWRVRNDGSCAWNANYTFRQINGDALTAATVSAPIVGAGQQVDISVTLTVGDDVDTYDENERATFRMFSPSGIAFGDSPFVEVDIILADAPDPNCTDSATFTSEPLSPFDRGDDADSLLGAADRQVVSWTIQNTGDCTWRGYTITERATPTQAEQTEDIIVSFELTGTNLPLVLPVMDPDDTHTFSVTVAIGDDFSGFGLLYLGLALSDTNGTRVLDFTYGIPADTMVDCEWDSDFIADITIPDGTVVEAGETFTKTWRLENSGTCAWSNAPLMFVSDPDNAFEIVTPAIIPYAAPGDLIDVSVELRVLETIADGETVRATFQVLGPESTPMGTRPYVEVEVSNP